MARAKHREKGWQRQFQSFVASCRRQEAHAELVANHKEFKKTHKKDANG